MDIKSINNLFALIKVNYIAKNTFVTIKYNSTLITILRWLQKKGYILSFKQKNKYTLTIFLKYYNSLPLFKHIQIYCKPSKINTIKHKNLKYLVKSDPFGVIWTKKGLMFFSESFNKQLGGIPLFSIKI